MRIRNGFVSNSSSSSFIVTDKELPTTARVALIMLCRVADDLSLGVGVPKRLEESIEFLIQNLNLDIPIHFPWSINDHTYIWRENGEIVVITSINHQFNEEMKIDYMNYRAQDSAHESKYDVKFLSLIDMKQYVGNRL